MEAGTRTQCQAPDIVAKGSRYRCSDQPKRRSLCSTAGGWASEGAPGDRESKRANNCGRRGEVVEAVFEHQAGVLGETIKELNNHTD
jgi:hypothetical protein